MVNEYGMKRRSHHHSFLCQFCSITLKKCSTNRQTNNALHRKCENNLLDSWNPTPTISSCSWRIIMKKIRIKYLIKRENKLWFYKIQEEENLLTFIKFYLSWRFLLWISFMMMKTYFCLILSIVCKFEEVLNYS